MLWWSVGVVVSIDTVLALTNSPSRHCSAAQPCEPSSAAPHTPHQPAISQGSGWSQELSEYTTQHPIIICTLAGSADKRVGEQTGGQDVRLRRQVGRSWRRSKRQSAFYLQACPAAHIDGRVDTHPDALPPGSEGASPSRPCEPMGATTIAAASSACQRPHRPAEKVSPSLFFLSDMGWSRG